MLVLYIAIVLGLILVMLVHISRQLHTHLQYEKGTRALLRDVQKQVHTRQTQASMQSGAETLEQGLARMGKATVGRRIVVGGEEESQLNHDLAAQRVGARTVRRGGDEEVSDDE